MRTKAKVIPHGTPDGYNIHQCRCANCVAAGRLRINGKYVHPGTELSIKGKRGRYRVIDVGMTGDGKTIINTFGGRSGHELLHSFYVHSVSHVHRLERMRS